jgi:hypothetical protein
MNQRSWRGGVTLDAVLASQARDLMRFAMEWAAGFVLAALAAAGPLMRLALAGERQSVPTVLVVALLIPSLALALW